MWRSLVGTLGSSGGTSGTVTVPAGAIITMLHAHASSGGASVTLPTPISGAASQTVPVPSGTWWAPQWLHTLFVSGNNATTSGSQNITFSGTDSYYVEWVKSGNT
jgi:hypothetical protein